MRCLWPQSSGRKGAEVSYDGGALGVGLGNEIRRGEKGKGMGWDRETIGVGRSVAYRRMFLPCTWLRSYGLNASRYCGRMRFLATRSGVRVVFVQMLY